MQIIFLLVLYLLCARIQNEFPDIWHGLRNILYCKNLYRAQVNKQFFKSPWSSCHSTERCAEAWSPPHYEPPFYIWQEWGNRFIIEGINKLLDLGATYLWSCFGNTSVSEPGDLKLGAISLLEEEAPFLSVYGEINVGEGNLWTQPANVQFQQIWGTTRLIKTYCGRYIFIYLYAISIIILSYANGQL